MKVSPSMYMAWRNLSRNRMRSILATLGVIIGVGAIVALGILGNTLETSAENTLGDVGNQVIVSPAVNQGYTYISRQDVNEIRRIIARTGGVEMMPLMVDNWLVEGEEGSRDTRIYGTENPSALYEVREGRLPERHTGGVILGSDLANATGSTTTSSVEINGRNYRVIGILKPVEEFGFTESPNDAAILPESEVGHVGYETVIIKANNLEIAADVADEIQRNVNARDRVVHVLEVQDIVQQIEEFFGLLATFLVSLAAISLIVAAVSILNVMLMSTVERKEEIGVLRAVGVQRREVMRMILVEAALLGFVGGVIGVLLGLLTVPLIYFRTEVGLDVLLIMENAEWTAMAFVFGLGVCVLSGLYPAWKAANERPVDALRS